MQPSRMQRPPTGTAFDQTDTCPHLPSHARGGVTGASPTDYENVQVHLISVPDGREAPPR